MEELPSFYPNQVGGGAIRLQVKKDSIFQCFFCKPDRRTSIDREIRLATDVGTVYLEAEHCDRPQEDLNASGSSREL